MGNWVNYVGNLTKLVAIPNILYLRSLYLDSKLVIGLSRVFASILVPSCSRYDNCQLYL